SGPARSVAVDHRERPVNCQVLLECHRPSAVDPGQQSRQPARGDQLARLSRRARGERPRTHRLVWPPAALAPACPSSAVGVPERRAQLEPSGPPGSHSSKNSEKAAAPPSTAPRARRFSGQPSITPSNTAASTTIRQATLRTSIQVLFTSLPAPNPCSSAIGQLAYVSQWTARQLA